ncbi:MAG: zinc dependent phospholipase C family protein [Spirochaetales bacterium]|nr:zinc dependent phospholipase C family protein [Spirochaetales bacterium]
MATWITHLRVAEKFQHEYSRKDYQYFLIGNIAPDAGILNPDKKTYSTPSSISHFRNKNIPKWKTEDLMFYRKYVKTNENKLSSKERSFKIGYLYHLFLDNLWEFYINRPAKKKFCTQFNENPLFIREIKKDWYGIDIEFIQKNPDWNTWKLFINSKYDDNLLDFYPEEAINKKIKDIIDLYS